MLCPKKFCKHQSEESPKNEWVTHFCKRLPRILSSKIPSHVLSLLVPFWTVLFDLLSFSLSRIFCSELDVQILASLSKFWSNISFKDGRRIWIIRKGQNDNEWEFVKNQKENN
jgi:hypothetical protein